MGIGKNEQLVELELPLTLNRPLIHYSTSTTTEKMAGFHDFGGEGFQQKVSVSVSDWKLI